MVPAPGRRRGFWSLCWSRLQYSQQTPDRRRCGAADDSRRRSCELSRAAISRAARMLTAADMTRRPTSLLRSRLVLRGHGGIGASIVRRRDVPTGVGGRGGTEEGQLPTSSDVLAVARLGGHKDPRGPVPRGGSRGPRIVASWGRVASQDSATSCWGAFEGGGPVPLVRGAEPGRLGRGCVPSPSVEAKPRCLGGGEACQWPKRENKCGPRGPHVYVCTVECTGDSFVYFGAQF